MLDRLAIGCAPSELDRLRMKPSLLCSWFSTPLVRMYPALCSAAPGGMADMHCACQKCAGTGCTILMCYCVATHCKSQCHSLSWHRGWETCLWVPDVAEKNIFGRACTSHIVSPCKEHVPYSFDAQICLHHPVRGESLQLTCRCVSVGMSLRDITRLLLWRPCGHGNSILSSGGTCQCAICSNTSEEPGGGHATCIGVTHKRRAVQGFCEASVHA